MIWRISAFVPVHKIECIQHMCEQPPGHPVGGPRKAFVSFCVQMEKWTIEKPKGKKAPK